MAVEPTSPANGKTRVTERTRIPMSSGQQKLAVPEIPGYHLHWMLGTPERIQQALNAGYLFVDQSETDLVNLQIGGDAKKSGNTDLGSRISALAGSEIGIDGQPVRLYLMKLPQEFRDADLKAQEAKSDLVRQAILKGDVEGGANGDTSNRYVGNQTNTNMFQPKPIRRT